MANVYGSHRERKRPGDKTHCEILIRKIPRALRDHFKALCNRRGITVTDALIRMMREKLYQEAANPGTPRFTLPPPSERIEHGPAQHEG